MGTKKVSKVLSDTNYTENNAKKIEGHKLGDEINHIINEIANQQQKKNYFWSSKIFK